MRQSGGELYELYTKGGFADLAEIANNFGGVLKEQRTANI